MKRKPSSRVASAVAVLAGALAAGVAWSQAPGLPPTPGFASKPIHATPIAGDDAREIVVIAVSIEPGGYSPPHTHPGECVGVVLEGTVDLVAEGKDLRRVAAGDAFSNARGTVHQFRNTGDKPVRMATTLVVDKGKPRTQAVPAAK